MSNPLPHLRPTSHILYTCTIHPATPPAPNFDRPHVHPQLAFGNMCKQVLITNDLRYPKCMVTPSRSPLPLAPHIRSFTVYRPGYIAGAETVEMFTDILDRHFTIDLNYTLGFFMTIVSTLTIKATFTGGQFLSSLASSTPLLFVTQQDTVPGCDRSRQWQRPP
jgi:hypothetical protein